MNDFQLQQLGKLLIIVGLTISVLGLCLIFLSKFGLFKLPGDIHLQGKNYSVYFPIASCIIISIVLTAAFWIINYFRK